MDKQQMIEEAKKQAELLLEKAIAEYGDKAVEMLMEKIAEVIPGKLDDMAIEAIKPKAKEMIKEVLLKQVEKISEQV